MTPANRPIKERVEASSVERGQRMKRSERKSEERRRDGGSCDIFAEEEIRINYF